MNKKYLAVILILASNNNEIYRNARKVWKNYMNKVKDIKVFFVYGKLDNSLEDHDDADLVYDDIGEGYPITIKKTVLAIDYINKNYEFDFFIRTNISTFWDLEKLKVNLNSYPTTDFYYGDGPLPGYNQNGFYLSGTDTIVTNDLIKKLVENKHMIDYNFVEDGAMGKFFHGYLKTPMTKSKMCFFEDIVDANKQNSLIIDRIDKSILDKIDHYRVKNHHDRLYNDLHVYKLLLKKIYNEEL